MSTIHKTVEVAVPVSTAYNQWTQFESFPQFMDGVEQIVQVDEKRTHWKTRIAGVEREFDAEITEQHPDERIAWHTLEGPRQAGVVTFHRLGEGKSMVTLQMDFEPDGAAENVGDKLGIVERRVAADLDRFKRFIESRGVESGGWRGDVERPPG
jgi:uncharacterized membrane protein